MMEGFWLALGMTTLAGLATGIGGIIAVVKQNPGKRFMAGALGFSAGVMIYVSFVEILPNGFEELTDAWGRAGPWAAAAAFFAGVLLIAGIDRLIPESINPHDSEKINDPAFSSERNRLMRMGTITALAIAVHNFPEGFATFAAALADPYVAVPIVVAIAMHNIPEGVAVAVPVRQATGSRAKAVIWSFVAGLAEPAGALIGFFLLQAFLGPVAMGMVFASIAGIMVFVSLDKLVPTAVATGRHHTAVYGLFAGMALMALSLLILE